MWLFFQKSTDVINFKQNFLVITTHMVVFFVPYFLKYFKVFFIIVVLFSHGKYSGSVDTDFMLLEGGDIKMILSFREL